MKNLKIIESEAALHTNETGFAQDSSISFVRFDDEYAVGDDGAIYQVVESIDNECNPVLVYEHEDFFLNYAETNRRELDNAQNSQYDKAINILEENNYCPTSLIN